MSKIFDRTPVLGVNISAIDLAQAASTILEWLVSPGTHYVTVTGVHGVMESQRSPELKRIHNEASLVVPDGMPMVWLSHAAGHRTVSRVYGPDLFLEVSRRMGDGHRAAFYYGAAEGVAETLAARTERMFPGIRTAGCHSPPFGDLTQVQKDRCVAMINASGADIVWVGLSTPRQERWMNEFRPRLNAPVLVGVGAAFDFHTGRVPQAPAWVQRIGMEWCFRLCMEPKRLWRRYLRNNPLFVWYLVLERLRLRSFR